MPSSVFGGTPASQGQSGKPFSSNIFLPACAPVLTVVTCFGPRKTRNLPDWQRDPSEVPETRSQRPPRSRPWSDVRISLKRLKTRQQLLSLPLPLHRLSLSEASLDTDLQSGLEINFPRIIKLSIRLNILKSETSGGPKALPQGLACLPEADAGCGSAGDGGGGSPAARPLRVSAHPFQPHVLSSAQPPETGRQSGTARHPNRNPSFHLLRLHSCSTVGLWEGVAPCSPIPPPPKSPRVTKRS